jgi:hypothetical protein
MRRHRQPIICHSILPVLHEPGCPFCRLLKEFQADRPQKHGEGELHHLCNSHVRGLSAVQETPVAARIFMKRVNEAVPQSNGDAACNVCSEILQEEELRIRELVSGLQRAGVTKWFRTNVTLCILHELNLRPGLPAALAPGIDPAVQSYRQQLSLDLEHLRNELMPEPERIGWGAVGRAAEFLVSQRGLRP